MTVDPWIVAAAGAALVFVLPRLLAGPQAPANVLAEKLASGATVLDVRSVAEFRAGAHGRALNIPIQELRSRLAEVPRGAPVVVYCASGIRSGQAARILARAGFADVVNAGSLRRMPQ